MNRSRVAVVVLPHVDGRAVHRLAQALVDVTPMIELVDDVALVVPMRGPTGYFGGEHEVVTRIVGVAASIGIGAVSVGVASSRLAARIAASHGGAHVVPDDTHDEFLATRPVSVLERFSHIDPDVVSLLFRLGLGTLGAVAAVGRDTLADRFGPVGNDVHVLSTGGDLHEVSCEPLPTQCFVESHHDAPLDSVAMVVAAADELARRVVGQLAPQGLVACRVIAAFSTEHDETCVRVWYHPHGFDGSLLTERLRRQIEKWLDDGVTAGVVHASIDVQATRPRHATQLGLWGEHGEADRAAWAAIGRLASIVGEGVRVPEWHGGRDPMRQFDLVATSRVELRDVAAARRRVTPGGVHPRDWTGAIAGIAPTVPVEPRREIEVLDSRGLRVVVTGRHVFSSRPTCIVDGVQRRRIVEYCGPWPVEERWWDAARRRRMARMQCIVDDGASQTTALLVVLEQGSWWLVGVYG
jgi:protein ImuB